MMPCYLLLMYAINQLHRANTSLLTQLVKTFPAEGSLSCSKKPTTGTCPEPDEFNPHLYIRPVYLLIF